MTKEKPNRSGDLLEDLDITGEELGRIKRAFEDDQFKKLFAEYVEEISDPANRRIYETELTQLEAERGIDITFIHPSPGYVVKTISGGTLKTFINVAACDLIGKPSSRRGHDDATGHAGLNWSLPYAQAPGRKDYDRQQVVCKVYDVVFHPDTLHLTRKNDQFKELVTRTALEAVRDAFGADLDMVNYKYPKVAFKGTPRATVIRKKASVQPKCMPESSPLDSIYPPLREEQEATMATATRKQPAVATAEAKELAAASYTTPKYTLVHRKRVEYAELTNELDAKVNATVPHELVLTVELPLLRSCDDATLDVTSDAVFIGSERPAKYQLRVPLPYAVCEARGKAHFDRQRRRLVVTLPVVRKAITVDEICDERRAEQSLVQELEMAEVDSNDSGTFSTPEPDPIQECHPTEAPPAVSDFLDANIIYDLPPFDCENLGKSLLFPLHVRNVDPSSLAIEQHSHSVHVRFQSIGAGHFPQQHAFFVRFAEHQLRAIRAVQPDVWDNDVIVRLELDFGSAAETAAVEYYEAGVDASTARRFECDKPAEDVFEDAEDGSDTFAMDEMHDALNDVPAAASPQKLKQRSYSESNCDDFHTVPLDDDNSDDKDDEETADRVSSPTKPRTYSECSIDSGAGGSTGARKCLKGILKRRSSSVLSESQSSFDEPCSRSIPEEMAMGGSSVVCSSSAEHCKKSVRFDNNVRKLLFRLNSTVAGQRKPKTNKRKKKKRCTERRYSEGEASDYDPKTVATPADGAMHGNAGAGGDGPSTKVSPSAKRNDAKHLHDSGVDLREIDGGAAQGKGAAAAAAASDLQFKSGMIFELDM